MKKKCEKCGSSIKTKLVKKYEDKNLGIRGVFIWNTVTVEFCPRCPRSQSVIIPNLQGLIAAVAVYRVQVPLKLNAHEIRFLRKAIEWTAKELGEKLEVRPETISRWETGSDVIGPQSEKLFRVIVGYELSEKAPAIEFDPKAIAKMRIRPFSRDPLTMHFTKTTDAAQEWKERKAA
jgi:transcriptional regulator with XRE-family HTH domain